VRKRVARRPSSVFLVDITLVVLFLPVQAGCCSVSTVVYHHPHSPPHHPTLVHHQKYLLMFDQPVSLILSHYVAVKTEMRLENGKMVAGMRVLADCYMRLDLNLHRSPLPVKEFSVYHHRCSGKFVNVPSRIFDYPSQQAILLNRLRR
jgi:hypothetical protein